MARTKQNWRPARTKATARRTNPRADKKAASSGRSAIPALDLPIEPNPQPYDYGEEISEMIYNDAVSTGAFAHANTFPQTLPGLFINGFGELPLPLNDSLFTQITTQFARKSPFGKGEETVFDDKVRRSWELQPDQFIVTNPLWSAGLQQAAKELKEAFGMKECQVVLKVHKLLIYQAGDHFKAHRDSEKEDGMFGTLVLQLPSTYTGGDCTVQFNDKKEVYKFGGETTRRFSASYLAFFADCLHEILPVESGYRCVLVYNIINETKTYLPVNPANTLSSRVKLVQHLTNWNYDTDAPELMCFITNHQYSEANLGSQYLKGNDRGACALLQSAVEVCGFDIRLSLAVIELEENVEVEGDDDYDDYYRYRRYSSSSYQNDIEVHESSLSLINSAVVCQTMRFCDEDDMDLLNPEELEVDLDTNIFPSKTAEDTLKEHLTKENDNGATGNEGHTVDRWYRVSVFVVTSMDKHLQHGALSDPGHSAELILARLQEEAKDPNTDPRRHASTRTLVEAVIQGACDSGSAISIRKAFRLLRYTKDIELLRKLQPLIAKGSLDAPLDYDFMAKLLQVFDWNTVLFQFFNAWILACGTRIPSHDAFQDIGLNVFHSMLPFCDDGQKVTAIESLMARFEALKFPKSYYWDRAQLPLCRTLQALAAAKTDRSMHLPWVAAIFAKLDALHAEKKVKDHYGRPESPLVSPNIELVNALTELCDVGYCQKTLLPILGKEWPFAELSKIFEWNKLNGTPEALQLLKHLAMLQIVKSKTEKVQGDEGLNFLLSLGDSGDAGLVNTGFQAIMGKIECPSRALFVQLLRSQIDPQTLETTIEAQLMKLGEDRLQTLVKENLKPFLSVPPDAISQLYLCVLCRACYQKVSATHLLNELKPKPVVNPPYSYYRPSAVPVDPNALSAQKVAAYVRELLQLAYMCGHDYLKLVLPTATTCLPTDHVLNSITLLDQWCVAFEGARGLGYIDRENFALMLGSFIAEYEKRVRAPPKVDTYALSPLGCSCAECNSVKTFLQLNSPGSKSLQLTAKQFTHVLAQISAHKYLTVTSSGRRSKSSRYWDIKFDKKLYSHAMDVKALRVIHASLLKQYEAVTAEIQQPRPVQPESQAGQQQLSAERIQQQQRNQQLLQQLHQQPAVARASEPEQQGKKRTAVSIDLTDNDDEAEKRPKHA